MGCIRACEEGNKNLNDKELLQTPPCEEGNKIPKQNIYPRSKYLNPVLGIC